MVSFIIPTSKARAYLLPGCLYNLKKCYGSIEHEIIIVDLVLDENEPFKLGQVRNIGFKKSHGNIIVFLDVDIRFPVAINFSEQLKTIDGPFISWDMICNVIEDVPGKYEILDRKKRPGHGGCTVFSREQFEMSNGHSNLLAGWGCEDDILALRWCLISDFRRGSHRPFARLANDLYHVKHPYDEGPFGRGSEASRNNAKIYQSDHRRIFSEDSYNQTIWDDVSFTLDGNVGHHVIKNIRVPSNFLYRALYNKIHLMGGKNG